MKEPKRFGTFDYETYEWTQPLCADLFNGEEHAFSLDRKDPIAVTRSLLSEMEADCCADYWGHNAGKFDMLFVVDVLRQMKGWRCDGAVAGGRIISLRIMSPHRSWNLKDSYAVIQSGLDKALTSFDIPFRKVFTKEDYAKLETDPRAMCKHSDAKLRKGCQADTTALWHLVDKARAQFEAWGGQLKSTFSACALSVVKASIGQPLPSHEDNQNFNATCRAAYCGGRVEVFKHKPRALLTEYDVTSSYPWSMSQPLPWHLLGFGKPSLYDPTVLSIVHARVTVPQQYIPPLPFVPPSGGLFFPTGTWSGWFTSAELVYAIENCGVTATLNDAINYSVAQPFAAFINKVFALKQTSTGAMREFCKLVLNGCYGKFCQKPETTKLKVFGDRSEALQWAHDNDNQKPTSLNRSDTAWSIAVTRWPKQTHYALAAFVTGYSRILLHKNLLAATDLAYCDTDSVHCLEADEDFDIGDNLGQMAVKRRGFIGKYYAPKLYRMRNAAEDVFKSKGFPVNGEAFARIVTGQAVGAPRGRMQLIKNQLRKDAPVTHLSEDETAKQWRGHSTKRRIVPGKQGDTMPWTVREIFEGKHESQQSPLYCR